jgi:hypothetical protein
MGREWGKIASMFTKWPLMLWGNIEDSYRKGGMSSVAVKYLAPWALLMGGQHMLDEMEGQKNPAMRSLIGKNITKWAPVTSVFVSEPPLISIPLEIINATGRFFKEPKQFMDIENLDRPLGSMIKPLEPFIPGLIPAKRIKKLLED